MMAFLAAPIGLMLGVLFYGGLWVTVRHLAASSHPALLTLASFWTRMLLVLAAFLPVARGDWRHGAMFLAGFFAGRMLVSRRVRCT